MSNRYALLLPVVVFVVLLLPLRNGFTDDGFIHIQYANNLISHGEYSFNAGEVSFGTTSPLWVMILAAVGSVFGGGEGLVAASRVMSWAAGFAAVVMMFTLARASGMGVGMARLCTLVFATHAWFVRWAALSMETSSAVLAMILVGIASVDANDKSKKAWLLGLAMALAALLRPEAYLLVPVFLLVALLGGRATRWKNVWRVIGIYSVLILPWLVFARVHLGRFLPNTAGAKSGGLIIDPILFATKFKPIIKIVASTELVPVLLIVAGLFLLRRNSRLMTSHLRLITLWIVALPVAYVVFDIQVLSRYMLLASPFVVVLGFVALEECMQRFKLRGDAVAAFVAVVAVAMNVVFYSTVVVRPSREFSTDLTHSLKNLALYIQDNSTPGSVVAAADIGYLAFFSKRRILDLGGLVDSSTHVLREQYSYEEIVEQGRYLDLDEFPHVDYFIDREKVPNRFDGKTLNGYSFESLRVVKIKNLGIRKPGPFYYTLYRLHAERNA